MAPSSEPTSPDAAAALTRIVRLAARALGTAAAQFVPFGGAAPSVVYGAGADLRAVGLDAMLGDERGLVVADTVDTAPFSRLAPAVRFVAAVPVAGPGGQRVGALCVLDGSPRTLAAAEQQTLAEFGCLVAEVACAPLRGTEDGLRSLYEAAPLMMGIVEVLGDAVRHVTGNEAAARFFGTTPKALSGLTPAELGVPADVRELWADAYRRSALEGSAVRFAYDHPHERGPRHLTVVVHCIGLSAEGVPQFAYCAEDATEGVRVREALREREALLREVIDHLPVVVYAADRDGRFTLSEGRGLDGLQCRESAVGQSMYERYRDAPEILDPLRRAMAGEDVRFSYRVQDVTYENWVSPVRDDLGRVVGLIGAAVDVTERVQAEAALREAKRQAEEMAHLKDLLLTNMSHEIRTPLTAIIGFSELLADVVPPEHGDVSGLIVRSGRRLLSTLNSVLDLARLESEQAAVQLAPLNVVAEVEEAVRLLHPLAEQKGLRLDFHAEATQEPVPADAALLTRIVNNLVGNALKFTEAGGVTVEVGSDGDDVLLRVRDTGEGINEAFLPHLFDAFRQEAADGARPREGSGLGLTITKRLVDLMRGTIEVASRKGSGTTFTVRLPRHARSADARPAGGEAADLRESVDAP